MKVILIRKLATANISIAAILFSFLFCIIIKSKASMLQRYALPLEHQRGYDNVGKKFTK